MEFTDLPRRFSIQGRHTFDHWQDEKLSRVTVANTPENLLTQNVVPLQHENCHFKTWNAFLGVQLIVATNGRITIKAYF